MSEQTELVEVSRAENPDGSWHLLLSDGSCSSMDADGRLFERTGDGSFRSYDAEGTLRMAFGILP